MDSDVQCSHSKDSVNSASKSLSLVADVEDEGKELDSCVGSSSHPNNPQDKTPNSSCKSSPVLYSGHHPLLPIIYCQSSLTIAFCHLLHLASLELNFLLAHLFWYHLKKRRRKSSKQKKKRSETKEREREREEKRKKQQELEIRAKEREEKKKQREEEKRQREEEKKRKAEGKEQRIKEKGKGKFQYKSVKSTPSVSTVSITRNGVKRKSNPSAELKNAMKKS